MVIKKLCDKYYNYIIVLFFIIINLGVTRKIIINLGWGDDAPGHLSLSIYTDRPNCCIWFNLCIYTVIEKNVYYQLIIIVRILKTWKNMLYSIIGRKKKYSLA
jgi:hypothetical protein